MKSTLHEDQLVLFIISRSFFLRMRNVADNGYRENQNTFQVHFFFRKMFSL